MNSEKIHVVCLAGLSVLWALGLKAETAGTFDWRDGKPSSFQGRRSAGRRTGDTGKARDVPGGGETAAEGMRLLSPARRQARPDPV